MVLVDEYDKPILDALEYPEVARANRNHLSALYSVTKDCDANIHFSLLTGVTKFHTPGIFSGLNNLTDISLDSEFATICGFTENDLDGVLAAEVAPFDRNQVRDWYQGYSWDGKDRVYNPWDILMLCEEQEFRHWWHNTGDANLIANTLADRGIGTYQIDGMIADHLSLSHFDVDEVSTKALLFQTGNLTIKEADHHPVL